MTKWALGILAAIITGLTTTISTRALFAVGDMRDQLNTIEAQKPLQEQIRAIENEQMRQGVELLANKQGVMDMEMSDLEERIEALERRP